MISQYWKDQIPAKSLNITVKDDEGNNVNLGDYTTISVKMLGSRNEEINLSGSTIIDSNKTLGQIGFIWPTDRSLFEYTGDYVLQLELSGTGKKDYTSTHTIRVRELGAIR